MRIHLPYEHFDIEGYTHNHKVVSVEVSISGLDPVLGVEINTYTPQLQNIIFTISEFPITRAGVLAAGELAHKLSEHYQCPITQRMNVSI